MKIKYKLIYISLCIVLFFANQAIADSKSENDIKNDKHTDANIVGHVTNEGEHLPFVTISIKGTTIGTVSDDTGHYKLNHLPVGTITLQASSVGYRTAEKEITLVEGKTIEVNFEVETDVLGLDEIVVTGSRNENKRSESPTIVNSLTPKLFDNIQSGNLCESLSFSPGLRVENNCGNCGFTQLRINGLEGPYSQVLINSRPIFSSLAGVYGLEMIPTNMIERVEVIRGGGSSLYGANAIGGTVNVILNDPLKNTYEVGINSGITGIGIDAANQNAPDNNLTFNTSLVSGDQKTGLSLYGFFRDKAPFDANNDEFSELTQLNNTTLGARLFHRFGMKNKLSVDFFNVREERRGGNKFNLLPHQADIAETVDHNITALAVNFDQYIGKEDKVSFFMSGAEVERDSYYGANQSLTDYGRTDNLSLHSGVQYEKNFDNSTLIAGAEYLRETILDKKLGFSDLKGIIGSELIPEDEENDETTVISDQTSGTAGLFAQYDFRWNSFHVSMGARLDHYNIQDLAHGYANKTATLLNPRMSILYSFLENLQGRLSFSTGYRAPQIFDEDLHIATSEARQVVHRNDPDLTAERSYSLSASMDYKIVTSGNYVWGFLAEGFYTHLNNPFVLDFGDPDENGLVEMVRENSPFGATVSGVNTEINFAPSRNFTLISSLTWQQSRYEENHEFGESRFFRTPDTYGYLIASWDPGEKLGINLTGNYTGKMLVPYFGPQLEDPDAGELRESDPFFDMGFRVHYNFDFNAATFRVYAGMKNVFNQYQRDIDLTGDRDPGYIYGPMLPRTITFGIKIGNFLP